MTYARALAEAQKLAVHVERYSVPVSIELQEGVAGSGWLDTNGKQAVFNHHTVSRRSMGPTPILALCKRGRSDVPGPLCNGYLGYDGVFRIITMAWANHPGLGGPLQVGNVVIPKNNARPYAWGNEVEGGLNPHDWPPEFHEQMARMTAGLLDYFDLSTEAAVEHSTWTPRKIDRLGYTAAKSHAAIRAVRGNFNVKPEPKEDPEDMLLISSANRGYALVGAGYFRGIGNINEVEALKAAGVKEGPRVTDLQHDHVREACTLGLYGQDLAKVIREHSTEVELQPIIEAVQASVRETIKATPLETDLDDEDVEAIAVRVGEDFASRVKQ